ncbi:MULTISPECIES: IS3 family transposase [unclassified Erysipelothrix]|uniref:IS3 family transposase n=1 Tax=unclassified Erysipelothrix TaxID=2624170 RepID=UPI0039C8B174
MSKLTREEKIEIYTLRKNGKTIPSLSNSYGIRASVINHLVRLIDTHGIEILRKDRNRYYSPEFKLEVINRVLIHHESMSATAVEIGLSSVGILYNWIQAYKKNGYNVIEKKRGRPSMTKQKTNDKDNLTTEEEIKELKKKLQYVEAENEYLKKLNAVVKQRVEREKKKVKAVSSLRQKYPLQLLLEIAGLSRSTYYFYVSKVDTDFKNDELMNLIIEIYYENRELYGYRRIALELKNRGHVVNHKKVLRLMGKLGIHSLIRKKRKYSSYKGTVGSVAENHIKRDFESLIPNEKWFTDVTEFRVGDKKLYLSPILDACGRYIISYNVSTSPNLDQIKDMLEKAFRQNTFVKDLIFHSDQGWQYQHAFFVETLKEKDIIQSMSRKGNSIDNGLMESFFGIMKSEMYYGLEKTYKSIKELTIAIEEYIDYYNNKRIKSKLKGLTPAQYRNQSFSLTLN